MKNKIEKIFGILFIVCFLYFSEMYLLPFHLWYYNETTGIIQKASQVPGAMGYETKVIYKFEVDKNEYSNVSYEHPSDSISKGDTIIVRYNKIYIKDNWLYSKK